MFKFLKNIFTKEKEQIKMTKELKEYLTQIIIQARAEEKELTIKELTEEMEKMKNDMKDNFDCQLAEREAKIYGMQQKIKELEIQVKNSQQAYKTFYRDMMATRRVATEIVHQVKRLFGYTGEIYQSFIGIKDTADLHFRKMIKNDDERRMLLSLEPLKTLNGDDNPEEAEIIIENLKKEIANVQEVLEMDEQKIKQEVNFKDNINIVTQKQIKKTVK